MSQVIVTVSGPTGSGKSRIAHEIEVALKAVGVAVTWTEGADREAARAEAWAEQSGSWQPDLPAVILQEINTPVSIAEGMRRIAT